MFDLVLKNGNILTLDGNLSKANWVAVKDGLIEAIGERNDFSGEAKAEIDLQGKTLLPGFIESHAHGSLTGIALGAINLMGAQCVNDILDLVAEACQKDTSDRLIVGNLLIPYNIKEGRLPNRHELDAVSGNHPVILIFITYHGCVVNSKALAEAKLPKMTAKEAEGIIEQDTTAFHTIHNVYGLFSEAELADIMAAAFMFTISNGVTTLHSLDGMLIKDDLDIDVTVKMQKLRQVPLNLVIFPQTFDLDKVNNWGLPRVGGCLTLDGSPNEYTACLFEPYPEYPHTRGLLQYSDYKLYDLATEATKQGKQCAVHAIGERAIDQIIYVYNQVDKEQGIKHLRHRIEHFSMPTDRHIEMAAEMQIPVTLQPAISHMFDVPGNSQFERWVGKEKAWRMENSAMLIKAGLVVCGGSDSPVTPLQPLLGIESAVNNSNPLRRVSLTDALKMYTSNSAWAAHEEKIKGTIEKGKNADFVVLEKDPYEVQKGLNTISVEKTIVKGKVVFEK